MDTEKDIYNSLMLVYNYAGYLFANVDENYMFEKVIVPQKAVLALDDRSLFYKKRINDHYEIFSEVFNPALYHFDQAC